MKISKSITPSLGIAILGWGSLIWESHPTFDETHGPWQAEGPEVTLEFSRISSTRLGALTLVIDEEHGAPCTVSYSMSKRGNVDDAITDLRSREGTTAKYIGYIERSSKRRNCTNESLFVALSKWLESKAINAAVWTSLGSNFSKRVGRSFSVKAAVAYIQSLDSVAKVKSAEYIWRAPQFVRTPLRETVECKPWFK